MMLGRRIGVYEVVSRLGEGGMGVVYLARHATLGRLAAVKVLVPELSNNREIVARFFNEARAATAIRHPGIVEVYDFGFLEDQLAYLIMEYLEGESLGARLHEGRLSVAPALAIARGIARALQAAHDKGIVHRDLKPDNVFLIPDEESRTGERVKLLDFGIAKLAWATLESGQTRTGTVIGTPTYMAPEQCRGTGAIDLRIDLYALGCVLYEMLVGRPPFVADASADVLAHHLYFEPQRISDLRPDLPPGVEQLVMGLLAKDPAGRPASASDVVRIIDSLAGISGPASSSGIDRVSPAAGPPYGMPTTLSGAAAAVAAPHRQRRSLAIGLGALAIAAYAGVGLLAARDASPPSEPASPPAEPIAAAGEPGGSAAIRREVVPAAPAPDPAPPPVPEPASKSGPDPSGKAAPRPISKPEPDPSSKAAPEVSRPEPESSGTVAVVPDGPDQAPRAEATSPRPPATVARPTEPRARTRPPEEPEKKRPASDCTRASFQKLLDAPAPARNEVNAALGRLRRCKETLGEDAFNRVRDRLVNKVIRDEE